MEKPKSVEACFKSLPAEQRPALQKLRDTIAAAAFKDHYSFFPMSTEAIEAHRDELGERVTGKGTLSFEYGRPFPTALVKKVVRTRLAEAAARRARRK